jgi:Bacteriophage tail sheath protein
MMAPTYPGVYVQELPAQSRTITGVATSTAGIVGTFGKGPVNEAVQIFNFGDFEREFGGLNRQHEASYAVWQFFLNGGGMMWVVRVAETANLVVANNAAAASLMVLDTGGGNLFTVTAGRRVRADSAVNPGTWGNNIRLEIDYKTLDPATRFNLTVSEVVINDGRTEERLREEYRNLTFDPADSRFATDFVNVSSQLVQIELPGAPPAIGTLPAVTGHLGDPVPMPGVALTIGDFQDVSVTLEFVDPTNAITSAIGPVAVDIAANTPVPTTIAGIAALLQSAIRALARDPALEAAANFDPSQRPYFAGAIVEVVDGPILGDRHLRILPGSGARPFSPNTRFSFAGADLANYGLTGGQVNPLQLSLFNGADGLVMNATFDQVLTSETVFRGSAAAVSGIHAFNDVDDVIGMFFVPEAALLTPNNMRAVYSELIAYATDRRAMAIVDVGINDDSLEEMQSWLDDNALLRSANACVYCPRPLIPDPRNNGALRSVAASGSVGGLWAETDATRGVWKAPAGIEARLDNVPTLATAFSNEQQGVLNTLGVNCLRTFPVFGNIVWGARTLDGADALASQWKYLPVRRLFLFLHETLYRGTQWVVFEPNDEPLWSQIRLSVEAFLNGLYRQGAFQGTSAREAYYVKCDSTNNPQADIDAGIVSIEIGVSPLKPAEFVILKFRQKSPNDT